MMETREITVTIHREPEKRDDLLATLLIVVLAALAFTAGYIAANAQWRETISEVTPEPPVVAQETRAKLLTSYEEPTESITTSRYAEVSQEDCELIAKIVYLEARGEPLEGQQAVAEVILNRVAADNFPDSVEEVIFQGTDGNGAVQFSTAAHLDEAAPTDKQFAAVGQALYRAHRYSLLQYPARRSAVDSLRPYSRRRGLCAAAAYAAAGKRAR